MGLLLLLLCTLLWSLVGVFVKTASFMVDSTVITFCRFFFGVLFLGIFMLGKSPRERSFLRFSAWVWIGAIGKSINYYFENKGVSLGASYGGILIPPIQTVVLLLVSVLLWRERLSRRSLTAALLCMGGALLIAWKGSSLSDLIGSQGPTSLLFAIAAVGAAFHVMSQKKLASAMSPGGMNFSTFLLASGICLIPVPIQGHWSGTVMPGPVVCLILLGVITGLSFYMFSLALQKVPFVTAVLVSNSGILFTIIWGRLFYNDPLTWRIWAGAAVFIGGVVLLNIPLRGKTSTSSSSRPLTKPVEG